MKVSIITATNREISERALRSIENQTNKNFEWIVVQDGSFPIDLPEQHKFVTLWNNYGPSVARNIGFQVSDGDIITYLDSDDELNPNRVMHLLWMWENYPFVELLFSGYHMVGEGWESTFSHIKLMNGRTDASEYVKWLNTQNISIPLGVAHTRKSFVESGGFQRGIVCGEDGILWRRMYEKLDPSHIMFDDSVAGVYHINQSGQSRLQPRFEMGGFAFDGSRRDNGKYLDEDWFTTFNSVNLFEERDWTCIG